MVQPARRLERIPPYLFAELDRLQAEAAARGVDVISLGIGDPDQPTPPHIVEALQKAAADPANHPYPSYAGSRRFRQAVARWFEGRFGVRLDPEGEVLALIGSKEGLAHVIWAYVDPGDMVLVPDPGYPVYKAHTLLAGGEPYVLPLREERGWLPDLEQVPADVARRAKLLFLNYPNNPTGAVATLEFYRQVVEFARTYDLLVIQDAAYTEVGEPGYRAPSILQAEGARDVALEFHSLSKPFNMTGWRIGFAVGQAGLLRPLATLKTNTDSGQFTAIQEAAVVALEQTPPAWFQRLAQLYEARKELVLTTLQEVGIAATRPRATFYVWARVPERFSSDGDFAAFLLREAGVVVSPGSAYGDHGAGYFRISLTVPDDRLAEAMDRLRRVLA
ncbi:aminotransferase class I/II-fold pyridoxal phosphate-dependent enzyme [Thermaerobacter sp. PB12/4term]|uniref:LL-diaminopimelate aminotransferase n=1 Tax=Thermaerobacter sp. PB12/4term TaxID=2293838 RepID=UPI000E32AB4C|nr:LL-diaminopimelate aminotransferase [Thermaerobacter sp. PB12/4term]QIA26882.1 aminotransferase class I/II-fold pyridoxal phosphate-dependent enzyme [Thermaerobacter sp. PB12/4term]